VNLPAEKVDFVLNVFKRPESFNLQLGAVLNQTVKPNQIFVWENGEASVPSGLARDLIHVRSSRNLGVWSRFALALNSNADYICILDDDTIPGRRWVENCLASMRQKEGLYGARGLRFESKYSYSLYEEFGVHNPNDSVEIVDIVGHAWFFRREWLAAYWGEYINAFDEALAGEDMHFSFALQKTLGLPTLVPPHPQNNLEFWGSLPDTAKRLGTSNVAISKSPRAMDKFERALRHYRSKGFAVLADSASSETKPRRTVATYFIVGRFSSTLHKISDFIRKH